MKDEIENYYNNYQEDIRLHKDRAHKTEFLTSLKFMLNTIPPKAKILDACAGTGAYAFDLAARGFEITAGDIVETHVGTMRKLNDEKKLIKKIVKTDVLDLSQFEENSFDVVLCMGALYHLNHAEDRKKAISECLRVLKPNGIFVGAYINRYAKILKDMINGIENMDIAMQVFKKGNSPEKYDGEAFYKTIPNEFENEIKEFGLKKLHHIGTDGIGYAISDRLNEMTEEQFETWLDYHIKTCEDPNILGYSMHGLFIAKKI